MDQLTTQKLQIPGETRYENNNIIHYFNSKM